MQSSGLTSEITMPSVLLLWLYVSHSSSSSIVLCFSKRFMLEFSENFQGMRRPGQPGFHELNQPHCVHSCNSWSWMIYMCSQTCSVPTDWQVQVHFWSKRKNAWYWGNSYIFFHLPGCTSNALSCVPSCNHAWNLHFLVPTKVCWNL